MFASIKKDFPRLLWTVKQDDENLTWFFDKADGSLSRDGDVLFWYGAESADEIKQLVTDFGKHGRKMLSDVTSESHHHIPPASSLHKFGKAAGLQQA